MTDSRIREVDQKINYFKETLFTKKGKRESLQESLIELEDLYEDLNAKDSMYREELVIILRASAKQLESAAENLASAANYSIPTVFGSDYEKLTIELDSSGRSTLAEIRLYKTENGETYSADPYEDNGGGVNDVASVLLKLGALIGYRPKVENALICDEPSKHVSGNYREGLAEVFRNLSHKSGRQIIMVTHDPAMTVASDNVIEID
jgi:hypothetical protein